MNNISDSESIFGINPIDPRIDVQGLDFGTGTILDYWQDSYQFESTGIITNLGEDDKGKYAILDRTIFYPQGGGQPSDIGTFENLGQTVKIIKCIKIDNLVLHYYDGNLEVGQKLVLKIDKSIRIQNIQLHSTAHLIDYAVSELGYNWQAERGYSFPEGPYVQYIGETAVSQELIIKIENKVNELRLQNLNFVQNLSEDKKNSEINRKIVIQGQNGDSVSECGCGGTHISNTSELPPIKIRKIQSKKGLIKVSYSLEV